VSALAKPSKTSSRSLASYAKKGQKMLVKLGHKTVDTLRWFVRKVGVLCWAFVKNPMIVIEWGEDLRDAVKHFLKWMYTGFKLFGADVRASYFLTKRVFKGCYSPSAPGGPYSSGSRSSSLLSSSSSEELFCHETLQGVERMFRTTSKRSEALRRAEVSSSITSSLSMRHAG